MNPIVVDVETTIFQHGHAFSERNKLCYVGLRNNLVDRLIPVEYRDTPYGKAVEEIKNIISSYSLFIAFNSKFDLHWLRRYGIILTNQSCWDLQLADFIINGQEERMPSLNG